MFSLCAWNIMHAFYNGASICDHNQVAICKRALEDCNSKKHVGGRQYESSGWPKLAMQMTKAERLLSMEDINLVSSKNCCKLNCVQPFLKENIFALQNQMWKNSDVKPRKHIKPEVHRQFYHNTSGNQMVTLEGINVGSIIWQLIMEVS
jgi:hypothetical protein